MKYWEQDSTKIDYTSMIDVVFLLLIFFMLMDHKKKDYVLDSILLQAPGKPTHVVEDPILLNLKLTTVHEGAEKTVVAFKLNHKVICSFESISKEKLNLVEQLPQHQKQEVILLEKEKDVVQFDHRKSSKIAQISQAMKQMTLGHRKQDVKVLIDADSKVPYKIVLAVLNLMKGEGYHKSSFVRPNDSIFKS